MQHYAPSIVKTEYVALQEAESIQLLHDFLHEPQDFMKHPMRFTTSVVTCLSTYIMPTSIQIRSQHAEVLYLFSIEYLDYGVRCERNEDPAVRGIEEVMLRVCELLMPGSKPPVEDFPWLRYVEVHRPLRFGVVYNTPVGLSQILSLIGKRSQESLGS